MAIPAGTVVESPAHNGTTYRLTTLAAAVIPDGQDSALVPVQAEATGAAYNLGPGYYSILPRPVPGVASVTNADGWLTTEGADEESDEALRLRSRNQFAAVGQYHHDAAYRAMIAAYAGIRVDYIFFEKNAPRGPGTANAHIMTESGVPPQELVEAINTFIQTSGNHGHGDDLRCMAITTTPVDLRVTVYPPVGMVAAGLKPCALAWKTGCAAPSGKILTSHSQGCCRSRAFPSPRSRRSCMPSCRICAAWSLPARLRQAKPLRTNLCGWTLCPPGAACAGKP